MEHTPKRRFKKSFAVIAAVVAILSFSAIAVAAGPIWRYLETRVVQGEVNQFFVKESEYGIVTGIEMDWNSDGPIVVEVDGELQVILDRSHFDSIEEALVHLAIDSPLLPTYLPEGFVFERATFNVCPIRNPQEFIATRMLDIFYSDGQSQIRFSISHYPEEWGMPMWYGNQEDISINGNSGAIGNNMLGVQINDVMYSIDSADLEDKQLIKIAESLR